MACRRRWRHCGGAVLANHHADPLRLEWLDLWPCATSPIPPVLSQWLQSGLVTVVLAMLRYEIKASEARRQQDVAELKADKGVGGEAGSCAGRPSGGQAG